MARARRARARPPRCRRTPRDRAVPRITSASMVSRRYSLRDLARGAQAMIERLLEDREARQVRMCEVNAPERSCAGRERFAPGRTDARPYHAVAPECDLD